MFCCAVIYVLSSFATVLMGKRELAALLCLSAWCRVTVIVLWLFITVPWVGLQCVIVVFPDHTHVFAMQDITFKKDNMYFRRGSKLKDEDTVEGYAESLACSQMLVLLFIASKLLWT